MLSQIYAPIEYIIIDGGSTDETLSSIARHENELAYWRSEPDKGISDAFNKGIALASGDIIGLLNADDWYEPNAVADAVGCLISNNAEIVHGAIQYWEGGRPYVLMGADHEILHHRMSINHPTVFVKRDVYLRHGLFDFDYRFGMDYEWLLRVKKADISFFYIDKRLANMQRGGASDNHWKLAFQELTRAKTTHLGHSYRHTLDYLLLILKGSIRRFADRNELDLLPRIYRKYFGLAKKQRVE